MTRRSQRELEQMVDGLETDGWADADPEWILYRDPVSGEYRTSDGATIESTVVGVDPLMIIETADLPVPPEDELGGRR